MMRTKLRAMALVLLMLPIVEIVNAQGITFETGQWNEVVAKAKKAKKMVFVDFYTTWCGPCKNMSTKVFTQESVGAYFNSTFVCYKLDAEKGEGKDVAKKYNVTAYPTMRFINPSNGEVIYTILGSREESKFIEEAKRAQYIFSNSGKVVKMAKDYEKGKRDTAFLRTYYNLLEGQGKGGNVLNDYLRQLSDEELLTNPYVSKMSIYDASIMNRLVKVTVPYRKDKEKKVSFSSMMSALGKCFDTSIAEGNYADFSEMLEIKRNLGETDAPLSLVMGGGDAYMSEDELKLNYYKKNKMDNEFCATLEHYAVKADTVSKALCQMRVNYASQIDSVGDDKDAIKKINSEFGFVSVFMDMYGKLYSARVIDATEYYLDVAPNTASNKAKALLYLTTASATTPTMSGPAADIIISKLGMKDLAKQMVGDALESMKKYPKTSEEDLKTVQEKYNGME